MYNNQQINSISHIKSQISICSILVLNLYSYIKNSLSLYYFFTMWLDCRGQMTRRFNFQLHKTLRFYFLKSILQGFKTKFDQTSRFKILLSHVYMYIYNWLIKINLQTLFMNLYNSYYFFINELKTKSNPRKQAVQATCK